MFLSQNILGTIFLRLQSVILVHSACLMHLLKLCSQFLLCSYYLLLSIVLRYCTVLSTAAAGVSTLCSSNY